jgi:hypothetical protein
MDGLGRVGEIDTFFPELAINSQIVMDFQFIRNAIVGMGSAID